MEAGTIHTIKGDSTDVLDQLFFLGNRWLTGARTRECIEQPADDRLLPVVLLPNCQPQLSTVDRRAGTVAHHECLDVFERNVLQGISGCLPASELLLKASAREEVGYEPQEGEVPNEELSRHAALWGTGECSIYNREVLVIVSVNVNVIQQLHEGGIEVAVKIVAQLAAG